MQEGEPGLLKYPLRVGPNWNRNALAFVFPEVLVKGIDPVGTMLGNG